MDEKNIINEIALYYMNPKKFLNEKKLEIEKAIIEMNSVLLGKGTNTLVEELFEHYTSTDSTSPINETIYKTRADEQGVSATRGYKEIYFNEIIQNANDNTQGNQLDLVLAVDDANYELTFEYADNGFLTSNIIGIFNTEIHTKREDLAATGKHGVGIKSLFYFVDYLKIESNVIIEFSVKTIIEDDIEKISSVSSQISKNDSWHELKEKKTRLTIKFPNKEFNGEYNVQKLKSFIQDCLNKEISYDLIKKYFFGLDQQQLIFDVRGLLFTDKNKNKESGIKKIRIFEKEKKKHLFDLVCEEEEPFKVDDQRVSKAQIKYNEQVKLNYLLFTLEGENQNQNFSVAFPEGNELMKTYRRYYETYYIPDANEDGINLLINSKYSNIARTKLTDDESKKDDIKHDINQALIKVYKFIVSKQCVDYKYVKELSILFHTLLQKDSEFIDLCYAQGINNKYLLKYKEVWLEETVPYIVYKRNIVEEYEKRFVGQGFSKQQSIDFFEQYILQKDTLEFEKSLFIEQILEIYNSAFESNNKNELRTVLNVAGNVRDLIYYRIHKIFPSSENVKLTDKEVDGWNKYLWDSLAHGQYSQQLINISLSIIGRYKLHEYISMSGEIRGASFYEYLFSIQSNAAKIQVRYPTLEDKQQQMFSEQYGQLKERLLDLRVNKNESGTVSLRGYKGSYNKGQVAYFYSTHSLAKNDTFYDSDCTKVYDYYSEKDGKKFLDSHSDAFGRDFTKLLIGKLHSENQLLERIKFLQGKPMIVSSEYPYYGYFISEYSRPKLLETGRWCTCQVLNINFLRKLYAHSWDDFTEYFAFLKRYAEKLTGHHNDNILLSTKNESGPLFDINVSDIDQIFKFLFNYERAKWLQSEERRVKIDFVVNLNGEVQHNRCPEDYFKFLKEITGKEIYVVQTNAADKKGLVYWHKNKFNLLNEGLWLVFGTGNRKNPNEIIIMHDEKMDYREAIRKVLENIEGKSDILEKFDAFIPSNQSVAIQAEEYDLLTGTYYEGNLSSQRNVRVGSVKNFSCAELEKVIVARGNNNNKCCCCGNELAQRALIITENVEESTSQEYPQIIEIVCKICKDILEKSHKNTKLINENGQFYVDYICDVRNTHQNKEVIYRHKICDGVRILSLK